jgi:hypothetical protein
VHEGINQDAKYFGILQQGCDVTKLNAWGWPVWHGANVIAQILADAQMLHA